MKGSEKNKPTGILPAQLNGGNAPIQIGAEGDGVQCCRPVPGADLACVDGVVAEILVGHIPVLVAHQPVVGYHLRVEVHLHLGIPGDHLQGRGQVFHAQLPGFFQSVVVGEITIAVVCQLLHQHLIQIVHNRLTQINLKTRINL